MNKKYVALLIVVALVTCGISVAVTVAVQNIRNQEDVLCLERFTFNESVTKPETAIAIAKAVIENNVPRFLNDDIVITTEEKEDRWIVSVIPSHLLVPPPPGVFRTGLDFEIHVNRLDGRILIWQ